MIDLTPIAEKIQKRMFEKMDILGRDTMGDPGKSKSKDVEDGLTLDKMSTRSTFIRMTSGQKDPVILMGGMLKTDGSMRGGYDDIYGPRRIYTDEQMDVFEDLYNSEDMGGYSESELIDILEGGPTFPNPNKRPMPGIKSIDASFKGGVRALREATISWTCWSWEELNYLMPHFLAHGKTVLVQWGWVYDENTLEKLPSFLTSDDSGNKFISGDAYSNYQNEITKADGDFDLMVGIIKNFEFTTREDGGFDCQTIITSVGASVLEANQPNQTVLDPNISYNLSYKMDSKELAEKIEKATGEEGTDEESKRGDKNLLIDLNTSVTLKYFIRKIDEYVLDRLKRGEEDATGQDEREYNEKDTGPLSKWFPEWDKFRRTLSGTAYLRYYKYKFISVEATLKTETTGAEKTQRSIDAGNTWVTWGWFEDNILSKFLSITSTSKDRPIVTEFRSVERGKLYGTVANFFVPVKIKNHPELETIDINHYILPGQFFPQTPKTVKVPNVDDAGGIIDGEEDVIVSGDSDFLKDLAKIVNNSGYFEPFRGNTDPLISLDLDAFKKYYDKNRDSLQEGGYSSAEEYYEFFDKDIREFEVERQGRSGVETAQEKGLVKRVEHGYLRNMLINTKLIKQAFGVTEDDLNVEPINIIESIETLFSLINSKLNFWNFNLEVDSTDTHRAKIVDKQITNFDFDKLQREKQTIWSERSTKEKSNGIFFFPTWKHNSFVKRQNITAKIPSALQLTTMYGANMDQLKDFANPGNQFANKSGVAVSGLFNNPNNSDEKLEGFNIAFKNKDYGRKIGHTSPHFPATPLSLNVDSEDIEQFLIKNSNELEESYEERLKNISEFLKKSEEEKAFEKLGTYDTAVPFPMVDDMKPGELGLLIRFSKKGFLNKFTVDSVGRLFSSKFLRNGEMKPPFIRSVNYLTTQHGNHKQANTPLLIPLELELEVDGIGGIYPGNSFHSTYVPKKYIDKTVFQAFDINHRVDSSGWTVAIRGKMRTNMSMVFDEYLKLEELKDNAFDNFLNKVLIDEKKRIKELKELRAKQTSVPRSVKFGTSGGGRQQD